MLLRNSHFGLILIFVLQGSFALEEENEKDSKIFGGAEVILATEAPWVASVEIYIGGVVLDSCGGTILSKTLILTAARCLLKGKVPADVYIRSGNPDYNLALNKTVSNFTIHPKFKAANLEYDAAMLVLKTPLTDAEVLQTVTIPKEAKKKDYFNGKAVSVYGWGLTKQGNNDSAVRMLHKAQMTLLKNDKCNDILKKASKGKLPSSKFCGDSNGGKAGVCKYDYGGPVIYFSNGVPQLVGIISDSDVCGTALPNIFTSLGPIYDFVNKFINPKKKN